MQAYDMYLRANSMAFGEWGLGKPQPRRDSATIILKEVINMDSKFSEAYAALSAIYSINYGRVEQRKNWLDSALILAQAAITYNPENTLGYMCMGMFYSQTNQLEESLKWYLKANAMDPAFGLTDIGNTYLRVGDYLNSLKYYRKAILENPKEVNAYLALGHLYWNLGIPDSAQIYSKRAHAISPESYYRERNLTDYYISQKEWDRAVEYVNRRWPEDPKTVNYETGKIHLFKRSYKTAKKYYLKSDYRDLDWGLVLLKEGLKDSATVIFEKAINFRMRFSENFGPWHLFDISRAHAAMGNVKEFAKFARLAFERGWHEKFFMDQDPFFDEIHESPEFKQISKEFNQKNQQIRKDVPEAASKTLETSANR